MDAVLRMSEALAVLETAGYTLTPRQVRYVGVVSVASASTVRLFSLTDVALLAVFADLTARCVALGLPRYMARVALRYRQADVRRAIERRMPRFLVMDPIMGTATLSESADVRGAAIDLRDVRARVSAASECQRGIPWREASRGRARRRDGRRVV
jgi:hypothetical protein